MSVAGETIGREVFLHSMLATGMTWEQAETLWGELDLSARTSFHYIGNRLAERAAAEWWKEHALVKTAQGGVVALDAMEKAFDAVYMRVAAMRSDEFMHGFNLAMSQVEVARKALQDGILS